MQSHARLWRLGQTMEEGWHRPSSLLAEQHSCLTQPSQPLLCCAFTSVSTFLTEVESEPEEGWGGNWQCVGGFPWEFRTGDIIPFLSPKHRQAGLEQKERRTNGL